MLGVSDRYLEAIKYPQKRTTTVTITTPDAVTVTAEVKSGTIKVDGGSRIRRSGSLQIVGGSAVYELVSAPGATFLVEHGFNYGSVSELIPVITAEMSGGAQTFDDGTIKVALLGMGTKLSRCRFLTPYAPAAATTRVAAITAVVTTAMPTVTVVNESTDTGTVGVDQVWSDGPLSVISDLTKDGGTEAFFRPDGVFVIRDQATMASAYVWTAAAGQGGVLTSVDRTRPTDRFYNTVVVRPSATDNTQTWAQQTAQVTDTAHPLHPDRVGVVPYFWASPSITTAAEASVVAARILDRVLGITETLSIGLVSNPALEANEAIRVITPRVNLEPARIFQHFADSFSFNLATGDMSIATRSQGLTTDA